jgi:Putative auto-transporter adhesin, head GIN domain/Domain of unknown function (DUF5668)
MSHAISPSTTRSIFGPLVLIAIGALWLLSDSGVISASNVWAVLRFWPLLLIALGVDALLRWRWPILANLVDVVVVGLAVAAIIFAPRLGLAGSSGWIGMLPFMIGGRPGSGQVITETRTVRDFDFVTFSSLGDLAIQQGEHESLTIEAEDDILRHIRTEVRDGTLHIDFDEAGTRLSVYPTRPIRFTLTVVQLEAVELSGAGNVVVNTLETDRLQARLSGTGGLTMNDLAVDAFVAELSGAGSLSASGTADHLDVIVSGFGSFNGADLQSQSVEVNLSGVGGATVWAMARLNATISGLGSVNYYGQPAVNKTVSGLGTVQQAGDK